MKSDSKVLSSIYRILFPDFNGGTTIFAIVVLRVIATCLITNTHYNAVYPTEKFAVGGLLGDVLFFAVSGFCYSKGINRRFGEWYLLRWKRIFPSVLIMNIFFFLVGFWDIPERSLGSISLFDFCSYFIIPTKFLFFGAIIILYIPLYFCVNQKRNFSIWVISWAFIYVFYYLFILDKSTYRMNEVNNPAVLFLYFGAILIGITAGKRNKSIFRNHFLGIIGCIISCIMYFYCNMIVRNNCEMFSIQILVPITILCVCYTMINLMLGFEGNFTKIPDGVKRVLIFIANLTLEIYVVQLLIIKVFSPLPFPINWFLITFLIILAAIVLKLFVSWLMNSLNTLFDLSVSSQKK